jgi:2',3'-cyclic-nucleotide 2'-phosphodiesterase/3'-nucleotidase
MHLLAYDYYADAPSPAVGLARTASLVRRLRAEVPNSLLLDNGDTLQGNPMGEMLAEAPAATVGTPHPAIAAMNLLGYDAAGLGNHDFNWGLEFLGRALAAASFPVVCANIAGPGGTRLGFARPAVRLDRTVTDRAGAAHPLSIGIFGLVPPQILAWDRTHLQGRIEVRDMVEAAAATVADLRAAGAEIVVALAHTGISARPAVGRAENAALPLARLDGLDALILGHQHVVFPGPGFPEVAGLDSARGLIWGKPAVMAGFWGSHAGAIDLTLRREGGRWRAAGASVSVHPIARLRGGRPAAAVRDDPGVRAAGAAAHRATLAHVRRPVGATRAPLHSYFAFVTDAPAVRVVNAAQAWHLAAVVRGTPLEGLPILSAAAPFKAGGRGGPRFYTDVKAGPLAIRNIADLYLYPNHLRGVRVEGTLLAEWLEMSAGLFRQLRPGIADQPLIDPAFPSFGFDVIEGLTWRIDLSVPARYDRDGNLLHPAARRIRDLRFRGEPVDPDRPFLVATNSYRAAGGGGFPGLDGTRTVVEPPDTIRDILIRYVAAHGALAPLRPPAWRFEPVPGASAVFETGPGALACADEVAPLGIEPAGPGEGGFVRFRLRL